MTPLNYPPSASTSFLLSGWHPQVEVTVPLGLTSDRLLEFTAFQNWERALKSSLQQQKLEDHPFNETPYQLRSISIDSFDEVDTKKAGKRLIFVKLTALIKNEKSERLPGVVFLRGGSVAVLMILRPPDAPNERYVVMTEQARAAVGSLRFTEIPAGMIDDEENFAGAAAREIKEEVGIELHRSELIDMTAMALRGHVDEEPLEHAMYPSPGACDEFIKIFLWEQEKEREEIEDLMKDRLMGERAEHERITVRLMRYEKLLQVGARDGKTLAAWSLYEYLKSKRLLNEHVSQ